jgi:ubiquitin-protein ligase E3 B
MLTGCADLCLQCTSVLVGHNVFTKSLELLSSEQNMRIVFNALEGNYALCLLANLIQLAYIQREDALKDVAFPAFTVSSNLHQNVTVLCDVIKL